MTKLNKVPQMFWNSRIRLRFGLKSLMVFLFVSALGFAYMSHCIRRGARQKEAVARLAQVELFSYYENEGQRQRGNLSWPWIREWFGDDTLDTVTLVRTFHFGVGSNLNDDDLRKAQTALEALPGLKVVNITGSQITDSGLKHLKNVKPLETLFMGHCRNVRGHGFCHLSGLERLELLDINGCTIEDEAVPCINRLRAVKELIIVDCLINSRGREAIRLEFTRRGATVSE